MNWVAFVLLVWLGAGLEVGLLGALEVGPWGIAPRPLLLVLTFVGLFAPRWHALWAGVVVGVVLDVLQVVGVSGSERSVVVIGPHALGCVLGVYAVLTARSLVFRDRVTTLAMLSFVVVVLVGLVSSFVMLVRSAYDVTEALPAGRMLVVWVGSGLYTGLAAFPASVVFAVVRPLVGFDRRGGGGFRAH